MVSGVDYQKANQEKLIENCAAKEAKKTQQRSSTQYKTAAAKRCCAGSTTAKSKSGCSSKASANHGDRRHHHHSSHDKKDGASSSGAAEKSSSPGRREPPNREIVATKCYFQLPRARRTCNKTPVWYHKKYIKDDCGSGIVPRRYNIKSSRSQWCKTPLSMYQATFGELGRQILCGEVSVPRDVWPGPPSNIDTYIMPRCLGYYRKYDCVRPCAEEHLLPRHGEQVVRDRIERYWNPCLTEKERVKLDVNDFAPHNAYLGKKLRRFHVDGDLNDACW